jgi:N-acetylglucosamine kinase-like BadF-type ATPase
MILIADSGASKTHWVVIRQGSVTEEMYTPGFNPYYYGASAFAKTLATELHGKVPAKAVREIYFYGSGVSSDTNREIVKQALSPLFPLASISVYHDLHGAAIALLGRSEGIACILGTGSNSCHWDGRQIVDNVPSVGYLLGDEGSGTYMGKMLVRDVLIGEAEPAARKLFYDGNHVDFAGVLDRIYKEPEPNKFFAAQSKLIRDNMHIPYCRNIVRQAFQDFVQLQLSKYAGYNRLPVSFTGSVASNFQEVLMDVLKEWDVTLGKIMKEPMEGMIAYHTGREG